MKDRIRFIDSQYNDLFKIPDGGQIKVTMNDGEEIIRKCRYIDDYHMNVDGHTFHIAEYAEIMERNGNKYEAVTPLYKLEPVKIDETELAYSDNSGKKRGNIGYFRLDFDKSGNGFYHKWFNNENEFRTPEFNAEFNDMINYFHDDRNIPILKDRQCMREALQKNPGFEFEGSSILKAVTDKHTFYFRCKPQAGEYDCYIYCYDNEQLNKYKDISLAEKQGMNITTDKFFKTDYGVNQVYYNPDSNAGGQLVYIEISNDVIRDAVRNTKTQSDFFAYIEGCGQGHLIDVGTLEFRGNMESFVNRKPDFKGDTKKTMDGLKKLAGIEVEKNHKNKDMER